MAHTLACTVCNMHITCIHDVRCQHGVLTNRNTCVYCLTDDTTPTTRTRNQDKAATDFNEWRAERGKAPIPFTNGTRDLRTFRLTEKAYQGLLSYAQEFGYTHQQSGRPNPTTLLEALGQGLLIMSFPGERDTDD